ncbi:Protein of unknown function [Modicisalibacter ilicicola DSM 19980]|uniref:DUF2848 domain-containing protein n=1 Tax=Modicisalibacter ilicicola DSM 19980 TaxID=1121942 RepID=A0A1M5CG05_9GAMM|nr:DUF2848 domain-containing protein [Halomonas ilicicola]SHF53668.1 Protein of unknown function [Halomonas ilicicola DSM 19980]
MTTFTVGNSGSLSIDIEELVIAGWSGRDDASIQEHIEELKALGVKAPSETPLFYRVGASLGTCEEIIQVLGNASSGEAEVLLVGTDAGTLVGIASDHTDRDAETWSVAHSKQVCPKPMGRMLWPLEEVLPHWDDLQLESHALIDGQHMLYQQGSVASLLPPADLLARYGQSTVSLPPGVAMLCGTLPVIGGPRAMERFEMALIDPVRGQRIEHRYTVQTLPIIS